MFLYLHMSSTKYTIPIPTRDQTAKTVSRLFVWEWIKKLGVPECIHSNQSRSFENQIIKQLCLLYQIKKSKMTPYHPWGNLQVERFNCSMKEENNGLTTNRNWYLFTTVHPIPLHHILHIIYFFGLGMMPGYQLIIYFIPQLIEALVLVNGFNFITIRCRKLSNWKLLNKKTSMTNLQCHLSLK